MSTPTMPDKYAGATPGPWSIEPNVRAGGVTHLAVTNRANGIEWMVCSITPYDWQRPVDLANASLIADAPALAMRVQELEAALRELWDSQAAMKGPSDYLPGERQRRLLDARQAAETILAKGGQ